MYFYQRLKHTRKMKKFVKICLITTSAMFAFAVTFCATYLSVKAIKYSKIPLDLESMTTSSMSVDIYAKDNTKIEEENQFNGNKVKVEDLQPHTTAAFISIEDKDFYKHHGINKKRIVKAMLNNLKSMSFKEGASTITQQLIKNTHLSSEKTIDRKIKEIVLAQKLEKKLNKDQILENYLNVIFFGNNCYGLESASEYYFNKKATDLSVEESCTLAGIIKSPTKYSPITHYDNCLTRRNLVLNEMEKDGYISTDQKLHLQQTPITLDITPKTTSSLNSYSQASLDEASKILNMPSKQIALSGYKIHTYFDKEKQEKLISELKNNKIDDIDNAAIVINNLSHGVVAYAANSKFKLYDIKRQPASCLKPILVYAPALNEGVISPSTQVLDEPIKIENYSPENVNKKFSGYMSVTDAVKNSVNIPAIKVLSYIGIDTGKQYAQKLGIEFDEKDDSYALALGGMTYGTSLANLTNAYTCFANNGNFDKQAFVQYITDKDGKLVYLHRPSERMVLREDSAFLMTEILKESAKSGTARKLSSITNTSVASKTGTVGNAQGNTDAYNISYTPEETIGVWFGSADNARKKIAGGNQPSQIAANYIASQTYQKIEFDTPSSVVYAKIDTIKKETDHRLLLSSPYAPERYTETALFSRFNMPSEVSDNFTKKPEIEASCEVLENQILVSINAQRHLQYQIYKDEIPYRTITEKVGPIKLTIPFNENSASVKIVASYFGSDYSNLENCKTFDLKHTKKMTENKNKWYI